MKAKALSVKECTWMSEECHPVDELAGDAGRDGLCLPNIFKSKRVKPLTRKHSGPTHHIYHTARELLLELLDRGAVRQLIRRAAGPKAGANRAASYGPGREQSADVSEEEYTEALTWFSVVLQSGLSAGDGCSLGSELTLNLDGWQAVLKRNSFQDKLLSLTRLEDGDKLEALSALCGHLTRRCQALYTPGQNLAVKKYRLSYQEAPCPLHAALLCDLSSGFVCNVHLYCPEQLQRQSRKPVVGQVVEHLLRPFCGHRHLVQLDRSAWMEGRVTDIFSGFGVKVNVVPTVKRPVTDPTVTDPASQLVAHLQGWTGPALLPQSDPKGSAGGDVFLPGLWATLHTVCINTFVLHSLQSRGSGRRVQLREFTRTLASQLAKDASVTVPVLPQLNSNSHHETSVANLPEQRTHTEIEKARGNAPGVCGLDNSGNSCYLNAVLQCLCSTVPLVEHLLSQDTRRELARCKCRVADVFVRLLEEMWTGRSSSCAPVEARSVLCSVLPQFNNYSQQDAQELLLFFLNALHDNLKKVAKRQTRSPNGRPRRDHRRNCDAAAGRSTIVSRLFEGQLSYVTLCVHCDLQTHSTQSFTVLSLAIPTDVIKCSMQECLSLFFEQTVLTGGERMLCSVCGLRRETAVLTRLDKPPEILILHLKRFGCKGKNQVKLRTNVVFPMKLDLSPFLSSSVQNTSHSSYHLYAVVNHAGHLNMGHYTALCHNALTRTWHCFDDSAVREVQDGLVQSPNAYLLFYSRKPFQKPGIHGL
uniref:Ubiquitin carboxyl-terminal hydrolase n=1 Tax=Scophthalmus maximus TaxID=52904 RepID=A0A8D3ATI4_SCOMX